MAISRSEFLAGGIAVALGASVPARLRKALRDSGPLALLAYLDLTTPVRVWSRSGTLHYGGFDWLGIGRLGRVRAPIHNTQVTLKQVVFEISGIPPSSDTALSARVRDREAQLWLAAIERGRVVGEPFLLLEALLDRQEVEVGEDGTAKISIYGNVGLWNAERATNKAWTLESQIARYANDTGLSLMPSYAQKEVRWRIS